MRDAIQGALQSLGYGSAAGRAVAVFCADWLVFLLAAAWVVVAARRRGAFSGDVVARLVVLALAAYAASKVLGGLIVDPRPYVVEHLRPPVPIARDNGFPSDHTLLAALLAAGLYWVDRRLIGLFAAGVALVMAGRLAIAAHHTLDVAGSVLIVLAALLLAAALPLPAAWRRPLLPQPESTPTSTL